MKPLLFDDIFKNTKLLANDASNDVNRPPLLPYVSADPDGERE